MTWRNLPWQGQSIQRIGFCGTGKDTTVTIVDGRGRERMFEMREADSRIDVRGSVTTRVVGSGDVSLGVEYSPPSLFLAEARIFDHSTDEEWCRMLEGLVLAEQRKRWELPISMTSVAEFVLVGGTG